MIPPDSLGARFIPAFNARDEAAMQALVADDVEIHPLRAALEDVVYRGRDGLTQWLRDLEESWSELRIELDSLDVPVPGIEFGTGRVVGRGSGSTAPIEAAAWFLVEIRDGRATRLRTFTDHDAARAAFDAARTQPEAMRTALAEFRTMDTSDAAAWRAHGEALWTEDIEMIEDPRWPGAGEFHGREEVTARFVEYFETLADGTAELERVHGQGDLFVLELRFGARGAGSGARVEQRWAWLIRLRDQRIALIRPYLDLDEALAAAGLSPS